jgi:hypothetical protein
MPYCWWVLKHLKKFTELCTKSYADDRIDKSLIKLIHFLVFNVANQDKCRMLQHLREVGDNEFKMIEKATPGQAVSVFLDIVKGYDDFDSKIVDDCICVYKMRKKPIILSAAFSYVKYHHLFSQPKTVSLQSSVRTALARYINGLMIPDWKIYPFLFDKHVSSSVAKKYSVNPVRGWKGFIENEEKVCWDYAPTELKNNHFCVDLKNKYEQKRLTE